ncbi:L-lactate dehydrogenase A chain [Blattella germanica]|nr:L-lactate dehydrogenase A chain [Blattella germanica]
MKKALLNIVTSPIESHIKKVSVIGVGSVGMAISMALVTQKICTVLALVDKDDKRVKGEAMDLEEGTIYTGCRILSSNAGTVRNGDEEKVAWAQRNVDILKDIIPEIMKYNPEPVLLIVSGPVDILTYAAWKLSGLPQNRVLGSGTVLDSARFRNLIAERLGVNSRSVHGFIVGEHEENSGMFQC